MDLAYRETGSETGGVLGKDTLVIIPAWNEKDSIASVIGEVMNALPQVAVLVVSDGSTDDTTLVSHKAGANVLELPINLGVGGAMRAGFKFAQRAGYRNAVQVDADGQHNPRDIAGLLSSMESEYDIVIGSRFAGVGDYRVRGPRKWAMLILSKSLSRICHSHLTDVTSGFKAYSRAAIELYSREYPVEYLGDTINALVIGAKNNLNIKEVGVEMRMRKAGSPSHSPLSSAVYLFRSILSLAIAIITPKQDWG